MKKAIDRKMEEMCTTLGRFNFEVHKVHIKCSIALLGENRIQEFLKCLITQTPLFIIHPK